MKTVLACCIALTLAFVGCSSGEGSGNGRTSEDLSNGNGSTVPLPSTTPPDRGPPSTKPPSTNPLCPAGEHICIVEAASGACVPKCVGDNVLCVHPKCACDPTTVPPPNASGVACKFDTLTCRWECPVCDPPSTPPRPICKWDTTACRWECPVCDPNGPQPHPGCQWNSTTCVWDCPVCDPIGSPPKPGCKWDTQKCVWICL